ncbi:hypothetical protein O5D80_001349 [Batrachochytrium dendrobatidis]|nr:hypothetical protein O5D80_001349 [Batrachochytrium dendrobatidis]
MRLTDILLALTLVVTSSMAVVPPGKNVQTPQSNQNPRCQPGSSNGCQPGPSRGYLSATPNPENEHGLADVYDAHYKKLKKQLKDAEKDMKRKCTTHLELKSKSKSSQTSGRSGLSSFFGRFIPDSVKKWFGRTPTSVKNTEYDSQQCKRAERICKQIQRRIQKFEKMFGIESETKTTGVLQWFKN